MEVNKTAGEDVTLDFDIVYERGGCRNQMIEVGLFEPRSNTRIILPLSDSMYNPINKTRRVQRALGRVNRDHQGIYNLTMLPSSGGIVGKLSYLAIRLNVNGKVPHFIVCTEYTQVGRNI